MSDESHVRIPHAARTLFARHGFQRTSMADIAREAGLARATLYLRFPDKRSVFEALVEALVGEALRAADAAWRDGAGLAENLEATVLAKDLALHRLLHATPHGAELLALDASLTRAHAEQLDAGFARLLALRGARAEADGADLGTFGGASGFAGFVATASAGLKPECRSEAAYRNAVTQLCRVVARATVPGPNAAEGVS